MSEALRTRLLRADLEVPCPQCHYPLWIQLVEVTVQSFVRCPCCYSLIRLQDATGTAHTAGAVIEQQLRSALKGFS